MLENESPKPGKKTISTHNTLIAPLQIFFRRRGRQRKQTRRISAVEVYQFLRIDDILFRLGHFFDPALFHDASAVRTLPAFFFRADELARKKPAMLDTSVSLFRDHSLGQEATERLVDVDQVQIAQRFGKKARVKKMQHRMLDASDVLVNGHPIASFLDVERCP